jgi:TPP-dependent pyruvate/acetoin dehydrogenase alpha subunit
VIAMTGIHPATAARRTELLHHMLLLRQLEQHGAPGTGSPPALRPGEEAIAAGLLVALGPADTMLPAYRRDGPALAVELAHEDVLRHRLAVTVCFVGETDTAGRAFATSLADALRDRLPVLFCCADEHEGRPAGADGLPAETVDGMDVEAVSRAAPAVVHPVRAGEGPRLLHFRTDAPAGHFPAGERDPIRILAERMRTDHQLDDHALEAIIGRVEKQVRAVLATG